MNIVTPNPPGQIKFQVKTRPTQSFVPFKVKMIWTNEETNVTGSTVVTASYNTNDFLNVTASLYTSASNFYQFRLIQLSGSNDVECTELYRGELYPTNQSPYLIDSEPLYSYTGSNNDFIIY